jgi:hypothetical protein
MKNKNKIANTKEGQHITSHWARRTYGEPNIDLKENKYMNEIISYQLYSILDLKFFSYLTRSIIFVIND